MIPIEVIGLIPPPGGNRLRQTGESLRLLRSRLEASGRGDHHVLALTFFIDGCGEVYLDDVAMTR